MTMSETLHTGMDAKESASVSARQVPVRQDTGPGKAESPQNQPTQATENIRQSALPKNENRDEVNPTLSKEETEALVEALEEIVTAIHTKLNFSVDETTNDIVVKIIDKETDTVIRQFPSEELLELREKMIDLRGFLFDSDV